MDENHPLTTSLSVEQSSQFLSPWSTKTREFAVPGNNVNSLAMSGSRGATTTSSKLEELQVKCCCDGRLHLLEPESAGSVARQPFCGWEQRILPSIGSTHIIFTQNSDQSLGSGGNSHRGASKSANGLSTKSKCSIYQATNHKRPDFKSQVRSYSDSKAILYEFEHYRGNDMSLYIDKYRKSITYPKMEQKSLPLTSGMAGCSTVGESSLWHLSGRYAPSSVLKPKLFVLGEGSTVSCARPFTYRKSYVHGAGFYSTSGSKPKFRLSDLQSTSAQQQQHQYSSLSENRSRTETKQYPVPIITGFSSMQNENQASEIEFVGAEEDSDAQLLSSMTWVSAKSVPESYLISSVTYPASSNSHHSIPKKRVVSSSTLSKNPSTTSGAGFRGSVNVNPFQSLNRGGPGSGATLLTMAGKKSQTFFRNGATKKLTYGLQLSSHSMPLIKSGEKAATKTNRLGHLLKRKHRTDADNFRNMPHGEADITISAQGVY